MRAAAPVVKDLVLLGGGHSHLAVLRDFGMRPLAGLRLTLVTRDLHAPYSGMLPGLIAGHYEYDEAHIDLAKLAHFAGARLVHAEANGLKLGEKRVCFADRPALPFDLLSIDIGATPAMGVAGAEARVVPAKPIDSFWSRWQALLERLPHLEKPYRVGVVGGGAGGVELALAAAHRMRGLLGDRRQLLSVALVTAGELLPEHTRHLRVRLRRALRERGVELYEHHRVIAVEPDSLVCRNHQRVAVDDILWVTGAAAAPWLAAAGLATDPSGFVAVDSYLRSLSHPSVFAAGDVASMVDNPRPKAGVIAVRQGPPLTANLRRALLRKSLRRFRPQKRWLAILGTGDAYAVASRGSMTMEGAWVWRLKQFIDQRFVRGYTDLPAMPEVELAAVEPRLLTDAQRMALNRHPSRCGGCGSKIGPAVLERALARLQKPAADVPIDLAARDDAAVIDCGNGNGQVHSIDHIRAMIDDPFRFGRIAVNHALGDVYAMGATPKTALASIILPRALDDKIEEDLAQVLLGAQDALTAAGAILVGGHSSEGAELSAGFAVMGHVALADVVRKRGGRAGDLLLLCKPLGTGAVLAAAMRGLAKARWLAAAVATMEQSSAEAARLFRRHHVNASTDVTGFGILGHLFEMVRASGVDATLSLETLPALPGANEVLAAGITSSLAPANAALLAQVRTSRHAAHHRNWQLLFDPQTAGGLLAAIPPAGVRACLEALQRAGYRQAAIVGHLQAQSSSEPAIYVSD